MLKPVNRKRQLARQSGAAPLLRSGLGIGGGVSSESISNKSAPDQNLQSAVWGTAGLSTEAGKSRVQRRP